ncbi:MAG: hypothetical protein ACE5E4_11615 [Candidatus Binatia bacterium]
MQHLTTAIEDTNTVDVLAADWTGQKRVSVKGLAKDATIGEAVRGLLAKMGLVDRGVDGKPMAYQARLERDGRQLQGSELVGDALVDGDEISLQPRINAA